MDDEEVWIQKPLHLLKNLSLLPKQNDAFAQRFNTLTRILIMVCAILAVLKWKHWKLLLIVGLLILFQSYLSRDNLTTNGMKMKTFAKNKVGIERMTDRPAASFYTVEKTIDTSRGLSLQQIASAPRQIQTGEVITVMPKIVTQTPRRKKAFITMGAEEPTIRLKTKSGAKHSTTPNRKKESDQPDFMRIAFEELEDGAIADQDVKNMESLLH